MKKIMWAIVGIIMISCGNSTPDESDVKDVARAAILHSLKNPTDAKLHHNEVVKDLGNNQYQYVETVNATNAFGGSIAQNVMVKVKWNGKDPSELENWILLDIQFTDR